MKFAMKSLVAAAAIAAIGAANAAPVGTPIAIGAATITTTSGSGALSFSPGSGFDGSDPSTIGGLIGALNVGKIQIEGVGTATTTEDTITDEFGDVIRIGATATAEVSAVDIDLATGQVTSVQSTGGALQTGTRISGTLNGGTASVTNLRFDLANNVVYADLVGRSAAVGTSRPAVDYVSMNTALWTIGNVSGPTVVPGAIGAPGADIRAQMEAAGFTFVDQVGATYNFTAQNVISGLKVTQAGFDFFKNSLGLLSTGVDALNAVNNDPLGWGQVTSQLNISVTAVPEPSTYGMALVGLLMVGGALRARRKA